jgi:CspA family cold shock protein
MEETYTGIVVWFKGSGVRAGYGFISRPNEKDIFVHWSDINSTGFKTLKKDQTVTFSIGVNKNGDPKAINVTVV